MSINKHQRYTLDFFFGLAREDRLRWFGQKSVSQSICWLKDTEDRSAGRRSRAGVSRPSPRRLQFGRVFVLKAENLFTKESGSSGKSTVYLIGQKLHFWGWVLDTSDLKDDQ